MAVSGTGVGGSGGTVATGAAGVRVGVAVAALSGAGWQAAATKMITKAKSICIERNMLSGIDVSFVNGIINDK
jgi:hypothetical protein